MTKYFNIFNKLSVKVILFTLVVLFAWGAVNAYAETNPFEAYLNRANELINKEDRTETETSELYTLYNAAKNVPVEKQTAETKQFITNYLVIEEEVKLTQAKAEQKALEEAAKELEKEIKSGETGAQEKADLQKQLVQITGKINEQKATVERLENFCSKSCAPKCYWKDMGLNKTRTCSFCGMFKVVYNTASKMAYQAIETFSGSIIKVVIMAFAIWMAITILAFVSSPETRDFKDLAQNIIKQSFYVIMAVVLLETGAMSFFNLALNPVFETGLKIAQTTLDPSTVAKGAIDADSKAVCPTVKGSGIISEAEGGALSQQLGSSIICTMTLIQARASKIKAVGSASMCYSWKQKSFIIPHLGYLLIGLGMWVGAMILIVAVPFIMIDVVVELAIAAALIPMAIGAYAFKITRKYTPKVWETFLNSMFSFIFVCLIALMLTTAYEQIIVDASKGTLDELVTSGEDADLTRLLVDLPWWGVAYLKLIFVLILTFSVMGEARDFAGQFSGSLSSTNIGSSIGTMAGSFSKSAATKLTGRTLEGAVDVAVDTGKALTRGSSHSLRRMRMNMQGKRIAQNGTRTANKDGSTTYSDEEGNSVTYGADGSTQVTTVKSQKSFLGIRNTLIGKKKGTVIKQKNEHFSIARYETLNKDGTIKVRERVRLNSNEVRRIYNRNGTVNEQVLKSLLDSGQGQMEDAVKIAVAKEIVKQRMPNLDFKPTNHDVVSQVALYDESTHEFLGYEETHQDGSKTAVRLTPGDKGRMKVEFTQIKKNGQGRKLSTDGIINRKQVFQTKDGTTEGEIDETTLKSAYSLDDYYEEFLRDNRLSKIKYEDSMLGDEEKKQAQNYIYNRRNHQGSGMYEFRRKA